MKVAWAKHGWRRLLNPATEVVRRPFPNHWRPLQSPSQCESHAHRLAHFLRILGRTQVAVSASATAEAYNPSGVSISLGAGGPIAPACVKPWLLPNLNPIGSGPIFNSNGSIVDNTLVGQS